MREGGVGLFKKGRRKYEREGNSFTKPKSAIMIEGQRDSETGKMDKGGKRTLWLNKKEVAKKSRRGKLV